jgi:hypothetical protein
MLIETVITKGVNLKRPSNVFIFVLLLFFVYEFRKNSLLIIPSTAIGLLIICKNYRKRIALIFGSVLACIFIFSLVTHQIYGYIYTDPNGEMYSVPIEQVGSVYAQKLYIPTHIKQEFDAVHPAKFWETNYDSQISDPLKNHVTVNSEFLKSWVKLGLKHPLTYTEAYFKLEYPFYSFGPNDVIGNYAIALTVSKQPALRQAYATMCKASKCLPSFKNQILAPGSKTQLNFADLPSQIVANGIPIISDMFNYLFFNTGLPFYVMLAVAVIAIRKRSFGLIVISIPLWCILLSFLLTAPVGQFRYSLQIYYILPVIIVLLCREHSLYRQKQNN